jgi:hypothetical protein
MLSLVRLQAGSIMLQNNQAERILREHRQWTRWIDNHGAMHLGGLVLTNRRLIFLHKIESSPHIKDKIKELADAPIETVLNYAVTLNRSNFQITLSSISKIKIGVLKWNPFPNACLEVIYYEGKIVKRASFQFLRPLKHTIFNPQIITDIGWVMAIKRAMKNAGLLK